MTLRSLHGLDRRAAVAHLTRTAALLAVLAPGAAHAQSAIIYGSLGNFDISNDTGRVCHGFEVEADGQLVEFVWPARTREWWAMWGDSPLSAEFTSTDWSELLDTALLHARFWNGQLSLASELRLRVAKFGATPEDRARLRITFAQADAAEAPTGTRQSSAKGRHPGLRLAE